MSNLTELQKQADQMARPFIYFITFFSFVFFAVNFWMLKTSSPDTFQRLGALWAAILVLVFGFTRVTIGVVLSAIEHPEDLGYVTGASNKFSFTRFAEPKKTHMDAIHGDQELQNQTLKLLNLLSNRISKRVLSNEVLILFTATLQWGYGDLFHCWFNDNGWQVC